MRRSRSRQNLVEEFPELDQLVLSEIRALQETEPQTSTLDREAMDRAPVNAGRPAREKPRPERPLPKVERQQDQVVWEPMDEMNSVAGDEMLNDEEQRFVGKTVDWLRSRENRDVIMASIWSRVIDSDPDAFYTPPAQPTASGRPNPENDGLPPEQESSSAGSEG
jgi:hypothetical protein